MKQVTRNLLDAGYWMLDKNRDRVSSIKHRASPFITRIISLLVAEVFLATSILPSWALETNRSHLRPSASDGANRSDLVQEIKDTHTARDGGKLTLPEPQGRHELESYQVLVDEILREIELRWRQKGQGQFWIGLQGSSATGKTQLGNILTEKLNQQGIPTLRLWEDMWDVDRSTREAWKAQKDPRFRNHRREWIRWETLKEGLNFVRGTSRGKVALEKLYKSGRTELTREFNISPDTIVIYDGMYLSDPDHYPPRSFDLLVLLDAATEERLLRHIERDRPLGRTEDVSREAFHEIYLPEWQAYVETVHPESVSDLVYDMTSFERPVRLLYGGAARDGGRRDWATRERGIAYVREAIRRNRPDILQRYDRLEELKPPEVELLKQEIHRITSGHFKIWGVTDALDHRDTPYFHGSYIEALQAVFPKLDLNPLDFHLDWSTPEKRSESIWHVLRREVPHIVQRYERSDFLSLDEIERLKQDIYQISSNHFQLWGLTKALNRTAAREFNGSYMDALIKIFPKLNLKREEIEAFRKRHYAKRYFWKEGIEQGIANIRDAMKNYRPDLIERYDRLENLTPPEIELLKQEIYRITVYHLKLWGLASVIMPARASYFNGSYVNALIATFSKLKLSPLGFHLDWSTPKMRLKSIRHVLEREVPHIIQKYSRLGTLTFPEKESLKEDIYTITSYHFQVWGLGHVLYRRVAPELNGSYIDALMALFPKLGLERERFGASLAARAASASGSDAKKDASAAKDGGEHLHIPAPSRHQLELLWGSP